MKIKEGFLLRQVSEAYVVVATGAATQNFNGVVTLNATGAFLWQKLAEGASDKAALTEALLAEYDVEKQRAEQDIDAFITKIADAGLIEA